TAIVAFNPQFVFLSAVVNGDNGGIAAAALAFLPSIHVIVKGATRNRLLALGACVGLAMMGKISRRAPAPPSPPARCFWPSCADLRTWPRNLALVAIPAALISGWWYVRNLLLYGDPLGWNRMLADLDSIIRRRIDAGDLLDELRAFGESMWAVFGWRNIPVDG